MLKIRKPWVTKTEQKNLDMMAKNLIALDDGIEAKKERAVCKRCGVVYEPRKQANMLDTGWVMDAGIDVQCTPFKSNGACLVGSVNPKDYCPCCEEDLIEVQRLLVKVAGMPEAHRFVHENYPSFMDELEKARKSVAKARLELKELGKVEKQLAEAQATISKQGNELGELRKQARDDDDNADFMRLGL